VVVEVVLAVEHPLVCLDPARRLQLETPALHASSRAVRDVLVHTTA